MCSIVTHAGSAELLEFSMLPLILVLGIMSVIVTASQ